jgi:hypothetical protein
MRGIVGQQSRGRQAYLPRQHATQQNDAADQSRGFRNGASFIVSLRHYMPLQRNFVPQLRETLFWLDF